MAQQAMRVRAAAAAELAAEAARPVPPSFSGDVFLSQPPGTTRWRIDRLAPAGGNVLIVAQSKSGKTTVRDNLARSLCDLAPFLGAFPVTPPAGRLYMIDAELPRDMARRWLADQMIADAGRFEYQNLRGACSAFNILVPSVRREWALRLADAGAGEVVLDCLGPVLAALGLDESKGGEVGRFLSCYEELLAEAGVAESFTIHHMGHQEERSRGASRLLDWPDAVWKIVRQDHGNPRSPRFLSAYGRDVNVPECRLDYDRETRHLAAVGGTRTEARTEAARAALLALLAAEPGLNFRAIEERLAGEHGQRPVRQAVWAAVADGAVVQADGPRNSKLHWLPA
jgi:AAA domain